MVFFLGGFLSPFLRELAGVDANSIDFLFDGALIHVQCFFRLS